MAIAIVQDLLGMTPESYDAYEAYLRISADPPPGLLCYAAGQNDSASERFRIIEIWESAAAKEAFYADRVGPATERYLDDGGPPLTDIQEVEVDLHAVYCAGPPMTES